MKITMLLDKDDDGKFHFKFVTSDNPTNRQFQTPAYKVTDEMQLTMQKFMDALIKRNNEFTEAWQKES